MFPTLGSGFPYPLFLLGLFSYMGPAPCISPKNVASQFHLYDYILLVYVLHILYIYIQLCTYNISPYFYLHLLRYSPKSNADATAALALVKKEEEDATKVIEPWTNEPETLEELMDKYIVEAKFPGRNHGVPCSWSRTKPVMEAPIKSFRVRSTNFLWQQGWYIIPLDARPIKCFHISVDKNRIINI